MLPKLVETVAARRRAEERAALLESMPRKRSNRLQVVGVGVGGTEWAPLGVKRAPSMSQGKQCMPALC